MSYHGFITVVFQTVVVVAAMMVQGLNCQEFQARTLAAMGRALAMRKQQQPQR